MSRGRITAIVVVALLHALIGYAFITGLAYNVIKKASEDLKTFDVTEEPPPPEEEPPPPPARDSQAGAAAARRRAAADRPHEHAFAARHYGTRSTACADHLHGSARSAGPACASAANLPTASAAAESGTGSCKGRSREAG
jgi:hypothetical protein